MKTTIRVPTDQYAFIEQEFDRELTAEEAVAEYKKLQQTFIGGFGLETKDWNRALDLYLNKGEGNTEEYQQMSKEQQGVIQELKKAFKRLEAKTK